MYHRILQLNETRAFATAADMDQPPTRSLLPVCAAVMPSGYLYPYTSSLPIPYHASVHATTEYRIIIIIIIISRHSDLQVTPGPTSHVQICNKTILSDKTVQYT